MPAKTAPGTTTHTGFSAEERAAMKEHAKDLRKTARRGSRPTAAEAEADVIAKIAEMPERDRVLAERVHAIVKAAAPDLSPKLYYGMPAYAKDGRIVCFFQNAGKFKSRYATLGFTDAAALDDGSMWPASFALVSVTAAEETRIAELVARAAA
jgi:uncharacterized protein YdhG (YjbR/CyaY superfamily)